MIALENLLHHFASTQRLTLAVPHCLGGSCKRDGLIEAIGPAGFNALNQAVVQLVECFTTCERMANVDIPTIYGIHLSEWRTTVCVRAIET